MDIQRGDQVYHRGHVWTVRKVINPDSPSCWLELGRPGGYQVEYLAQALPTDVERVEQVR